MNSPEYSREIILPRILADYVFGMAIVYNLTSYWVPDHPNLAADKAVIKLDGVQEAVEGFLAVLKIDDRIQIYPFSSEPHFLNQPSD